MVHVTDIRKGKAESYFQKNLVKNEALSPSIIRMQWGCIRYFPYLGSSLFVNISQYSYF